MKEKFFNKQVEYFWEYEYSFGEHFLKELFSTETTGKYMRKYSKKGDGIYNLIFIDNKIYEIKFKKTDKMLLSDNKKATRDDIKDKIVCHICDKGLGSTSIEYTVNGGKFITFKLGNFIAKLEIIKKMKEPE